MRSVKPEHLPFEGWLSGMPVCVSPDARPINTPLRARALIMLACLGLAGCAAVGPDYAPPAPEVPASWSRLDPAAQPVAHAAATGDLSQWWRGLNDPLLTELIFVKLFLLELPAGIFSVAG